MKKRIVFVLAAIMLIASLLFVGACGDNGGAGYDDYKPVPVEPGAEGYNGIVVTTDRLLVYYVNMSISVDSCEQSAQEIKAKLTSLGGYEQSSYESSSSYITLVMRVPTEKLEEFLSSIEDGGTVNYRNVSSEDYTEKYTYATAKVEALTAKRDALNAILGKAENVSDITLITKEIYDVSEQIDYYTKQADSFRNMADYSTVTLSLYAKSEYKKADFWTELGDVFLGSTSSVGAVFGVILRIIVALLPYAILAAIIFWLVILVMFIVCKIKKQPFTLFKTMRENKIMRKKEKAFYREQRLRRAEEIDNKFTSETEDKNKKE